MRVADRLSAFSSLSRPWMRQPPPPGIRPTFFTLRWAIWPGQWAMILCGLRLFSPFGSRNRRLPSPNRVRCLVTVRRLITSRVPPTPTPAPTGRDSQPLEDPTPWREEGLRVRQRRYRIRIGDSTVTAVTADTPNQA